MRVRKYKPGKYGKGLIQTEDDPQAQLWRVKGWNGSPHHATLTRKLDIRRPTVAFHIDKQRRFYFHQEDADHQHPKDPPALAKAVVAQYPKLTWGKISAEAYERQHGVREPVKQLALAGRKLRPFEQGAHLHVLDWAHTTARYRLQAAGAAQVKAAAKHVVAHPADPPPQLPSLEAAMTMELRKLYALGHATVRSELDHQRTGSALPVGLSAAPAPPNLRRAKAKKGRFPHCGTCKMFDHGVCWGYGNWPVKPNQVCDNYAPDLKPKQLAIADTIQDPGRLRQRARLIAADVAHQIHQAVHRGRLQGITSPSELRELGRDAGTGALRVGASHHAGGAISAGRHAAALQAEVMGGRYTSVLDKSTCGPCADADTGQLIAMDDPAWIPTPNPACLGGDRCRCIHVYQLVSEPVSTPVAVAASR